MPAASRAGDPGASQDPHGEPATDVHAAAARGIAGSAGALPYADTIQPLFGGHDLGNIQAHTDASAAEGARAMGAEAFATGNHVAFASSPDLHTAAHEAAHVVQQRAGVHLKGGVGESGDLYEQNADEVADRVVQGRSAHDLLPASASSSSSAASGDIAPQRKIQLRPGRQSTPAEITDAQITAALTWVTTSNIGPEAIREVQRVCNITQTGTYGAETARAVFAKQRELGMGADGIAGTTFFRRTGIIFTQRITAGTVADAVLQQVATRFPNGVTIAVCPNFAEGVSGRGEFRSQANLFARNQQAVGLSGGAVALGQVCMIEDVGDVIEVVQSIHRGLLQRWNESRAASAGGGGEAAAPATPPAYTRVRNLALFSHGESWGMGLNAQNDFNGGGLHNNTTRDRSPANVEAFVRGLSEAVVPDVRVELFACSTGHDTTRSDYQEWTGHAQGDRAGGDSLASSMAQALGPAATVSAHTTVGHTTENYAARVFGAEAGGGTQGITLFDAMYPESFVQSELVRLFPDLDDAGRAARHNSLRDQMWAHFRDSISGEHHRRQRRYPVPMGQETFTNPGNARTLLHADWTTSWIPTRLGQVRAAQGRR